MFACFLTVYSLHLPPIAENNVPRPPDAPHSAQPLDRSIDIICFLPDRVGRTGKDTKLRPNNFRMLTFKEYLLLGWLALFASVEFIYTGSGCDFKHLETSFQNLYLILLRRVEQFNTAEKNQIKILKQSFKKLGVVEPE